MFCSVYYVMLRREMRTLMRKCLKYFLNKRHVLARLVYNRCVCVAAVVQHSKSLEQTSYHRLTIRDFLKFHEANIERDHHALESPHRRVDRVREHCLASYEN